MFHEFGSIVVVFCRAKLTEVPIRGKSDPKDSIAVTGFA